MTSDLQPPELSVVATGQTKASGKMSEIVLTLILQLSGPHHAAPRGRDPQGAHTEVRRVRHRNPRTAHRTHVSSAKKTRLSNTTRWELGWEAEAFCWFHGDKGDEV